MASSSTPSAINSSSSRVRSHDLSGSFTCSYCALGYAIDHSEASVRAMHDVAMFFVREAKLNAHSFPSEDELQAALMANYPRINLGYLSPRSHDVSS